MREEGDCSCTLAPPCRLPSAQIQKRPTTEELTVCESGWSLGIKGAGEIGWSASRGIGALSVVPPVAVRNLRIGWIIAAGGAELRSVETPIQLNRHYEQSKAIRGECYANQSS